jgi:hypothetical protein
MSVVVLQPDDTIFIGSLDKRGVKEVLTLDVERGDEPRTQESGDIDALSKIGVLYTVFSWIGFVSIILVFKFVN